tara:strand:+ start:54 stop:545 length:492 start_codon:yes stop_codon:yes gene_type:complete
MIFKTNENFNGDTITYRIDHVTRAGRIYAREEFSNSANPRERAISILGFGERFFLWQEAYAIHQLELKLRDSNSHVREKAASELIACFDFEQGENPRQRRIFVQNPANAGCLRALKTTVLAARSGAANSDFKQPLSTLLALLLNHLGDEPVDRSNAFGGEVDG